MFGKLSKCKDLQIEVIKTLPVVIGASGVVAKTVPNYVSQIPGSPPLTELQYITLMCTAHTLRKVLSM